LITPPWLRIALEEYDRGVEEIHGAEHNPRIIEYHGATTMRASTDEVPWCSSFVCWCLMEAGVYQTQSAAARSYLTWGLPMAHHPYGSIVVLRRGSGSGSQGPDVHDAPGHVGFLLYENKHEFQIIAGNQGDRVSIQSFERDRLLGCRWPG